MVAVFRRDENCLMAAMTVAALLLTGLMLIGRVNSFSSVPLFCYMLVAVAPQFLWLTMIGPLARLTAWKRALVDSGVVLTPLAIALIVAMVIDGLHYE